MMSFDVSRTVASNKFVGNIGMYIFHGKKSLTLNVIYSVKKKEKKSRHLL